MSAQLTQSSQLLVAPPLLHCISYPCPLVTRLVVHDWVSLVGLASAAMRILILPPLTHSHFFAERFFPVVAARAVDMVEPSHSTRSASFLQRLQMQGTSSWLLVARVPNLQQTLGGLHYRSLLRCRLCMRMFPEDASCSSFQTPMDISGDHALLCRRDPFSARFQLRHCLVQQALSTLLCQASIIHAVKPQHLRLSRDEGPESGKGSGLTRPADILLYGSRDDRQTFVGLVGVYLARGGWRMSSLH